MAREERREEVLSEQRGSITQGLDVHTRVALEQQVSNAYTASIYRSTWARITRRVRINHPDSSCSFSWTDGATLAHIRLIRIALYPPLIFENCTPLARLYFLFYFILFLPISANTRKPANFSSFRQIYASHLWNYLFALQNISPLNLIDFSSFARDDYRKYIRF